MSKASIDRRNNNTRLWVKEAFKQDQGRGIIRIDPDVFKSFKFRNGDILQIYHPITTNIQQGYYIQANLKIKELISLDWVLLL